MFYKLRRRLWHLWPRLNVEYVYTHDLKNIPEKSCRIDVDIFKLTKENVNRILEVRKLPLEEMRDRLKRGDICYVTQFEGKLIAYQWVQFSGNHFIQQAGKMIKIKPGDFWIYHARVLEEYRSKGINSKIKSDILFESKKLGFKQAIIYTNKKNIPNRKGLERLGFQLKEVIFSIKIDNNFHQIYTKNIA